MSKLLNKFFISRIYVAIMFALALLFWNFDLLITGAVLFLTIPIVIFISRTDSQALFPILFGLMFMPHQYLSMENIPNELFFFSIVFFFFLVTSVFLYKPNIKKCNLKFSLLSIAISSIISLINLETNGQSFRYLFSIIPVLFFLVYLYFSSTTKKTHADFLSWCLIGIGLLLSSELILEGLQIGSFEKKITTLGWGGANTAAIYMNIAFISCFYVITSTKHIIEKIVCFIFACFIVFVLVLTQCRAGYFAFVICFVPCVLLSLFTSKSKKQLFIFYVIGLLFTLIMFLIFREEIIKIFRIGMKDGIDDHGRFAMWEYAMNAFFKNPIIGNGLFSVDVIGNVDPKRLSVVHNFVVQCLFSFGIVGLLAMLFFIYELIRAFFRNGITTFKWFFALIVLSGVIHGLLDNTFYMGVYTTIFVCIVSVMEHEVKEPKQIEEVVLEQNKILSD